jgi:uncharacterized membrane protein YeiB
VALAVETEARRGTARRRRLDGIDVARALAFAGMLLAHYVGVIGDREPGWLRGLISPADGRAAPLFAVLLGVGAGLLVARGTPDRVLVQRGALLFVVGCAIWPGVDWVYLILPHYGVLLALVPLLRRIPARWTLPAAGVAFVLPSLIVATVSDHRLRGGRQPGQWSELADFGRLVRHLFWTGGYPLVGWTGFVLVGLWFARQQLAKRAVQVRLAAVAGAIALTQPVLAQLDGGAGWAAALLDGTSHSNHTAWYVLSSATAVGVTALCLLATSSPGGRWRLPLVYLGQCALSVYLAHIVIGETIVWPWRTEAQPSLTEQLAVATAVLAVLTALATLWRQRFARGPVEAVLRRLSG